MHNKTLLILLLLLSTNIFSSEQEIAYDKYLIATVGDFIRACDPIVSPKTLENDGFYSALSCLSYTSGVMSGYTSTLSMNAEYQLADKMGVPRSEITSQMKSNPALHENLEAYAIASHFLCFNKKVGLVDIIKHTVRNLKDKNIDLHQSVYYVILNEIEELLPCPKN